MTYDDFLKSVSEKEQDHALALPADLIDSTSTKSKKMTVEKKPKKSSKKTNQEDLIVL